MKSSSPRVKLHDENLLAAGGRKLNGIRLKPDAAAVLAKLEQAGESATAAINRLILESGKA